MIDSFGPEAQTADGRLTLPFDEARVRHATALAVAAPRRDAALHRAGAQPALHGVMRGERLVVPVGQREATAMAVRNGGQRRRWSKLGKWLSASSRR